MAKKRSDKKPLNPRVTGDGPATGEQYLKLQQKLGLELAEFQALLGTSVKDHYQIAARPDEPLADPGLALHVRLLDEYPQLVVPGPTIEDLVRAVKQVKRDFPETELPFPATAWAVAVLLGRRGATAASWSDGQTTPSRKIMMLVRHLLALLDERDDPDRVLVRYAELVRKEAAGRGAAEDIFEARRWPKDRDRDG